MKQLLVKLRRTLQFNNTSKYIYLIALGLALCIYITQHFSILLLLFLLLYIFILLYNSIEILIIVISISLLSLANIGIRKVIYNSVKYGEIKKIAQVVDIKESSNSYKITIKKSTLKYIFYDSDNLYKIGDIVIVSGVLSKVDEAPSFNLFNYRKYAEKNNIKGIIKNPTVKVVGNKFCLAKINKCFSSYFKSHFDPLSRGYLEALLIGNKNGFDNQTLTSIREIGISHLFVISGLHMGIIVLVLKKLLTMLKLKDNAQFFIIVIFFLIYYIITLFSISILRVIIVFILSNINKKYHFNISNFNIYALAIIIILLVQPYYLFNYAFLLTFLSSMSLVLISPLLKYRKFKGFIINNSLISINSIIVTLPVVVTLNPDINILSVLYNLIYIPFVTYIMLPLSFITSILPFLKNFYALVVRFFTNTTIKLSSIKLFKLVFPNISIIIVIIYYFLYLGIIKESLVKNNKKKIQKVFFLIGVLFIWNNIFVFNPYEEIIFMNLPQGEATLITASFNKANILIDTGENLKDDLELFLMKKGIKRLDYIFISHSDSDHNGKLPILLEKFKVKNVVITPYDNKTLQLLIDNNYRGGIYFMKSEDIIDYKGIRIEAILPDNDTGKTNNNSLVLQIKTSNCSLLLTGDIEKSQEIKLIQRKKDINVSFFKVPHHGSNTSSSQEILNRVNFDYAICMNGYQNIFSLPTIQTVSKYDKSKILITSKEKTIIFRKHIFKSKFKRYVY